MALNLADIAAGVNTQPANNAVIPNQTVQVVSYDPVAGCQGTGPISPAKQSTDLTPANMIAGACGTLYVDIDNSATGTSQRTLTIGGPFVLPDGNAISAALTGVADGYRQSTLLANIVGGEVPIAGSTFFAGAFAFAFQLINFFAAAHSSFIVTTIGFRRWDLSVTSKANFANQEMTTFTDNYQSNLQYTLSNAKFYASFTNVGGGSITDGYWGFGAGIPITETTGIQFIVPAGFHDKISICIGAVESNIPYSVGC